jgi:hypothetical protein
MFAQFLVKLDPDGLVFEEHGRIQVNEQLQRGERLAPARIDDSHPPQIPTPAELRRTVPGESRDEVPLSYNPPG